MADNKTSIVITALDQTAAGLASVNKRLDGIKSAAAAVGLSLSAMGALAGLTMLVKQSINAADELNKLAQKTGTAVETLAGLKFAADQNGTSLEAVALAAKKLSTALVDKPDLFSKMGITAKDSTGAMVQMADLFAVMPDGVEKTALAVKLMGRSGEEMIPFLNQGSTALRDLIEQGKLYNPVTAESAAQAELFNDQMDALKAQAGGLGVTIANDALPALTQISGAMAQAAKESGLLMAVIVGIGGAMKWAFTDEMMDRSDKIKKDMAAARMMVDSTLPEYIKAQHREKLAALQSELDGINKVKAAEIERLAGIKDFRAVMAAMRVDAAQAGVYEMALTGASDAEIAKAQANIERFRQIAADYKPEAKKVADAYDAIRKSADNYVKSLEKEIAQSGLDVTQKKMVEASIVALTLKTDKERAAVMQAALAWADATRVADEAKAEKEALTKAEEELQKQLASGVEAYNNYWLSVDTTTASIIEKAKQQEFENSLIGKTRTEIEALTRAREHEAISGLEATLAVMLNSSDAREAEIRQIALQIEALYRLEAAQGSTAGLEAAVAATQTQQQAQLDMWASVESTVHETWKSIADGGKDTAQRLKESFKNGFFDWLYQMTLKKWVVSISAVATGTTVAGMASAADMSGGSAGGVGSWLSSASSMYSAINAGITTSISQGVAQVGATFWNMGAETLGNSIMSSIAPITTAISYVGAGLAGIAIGSAIGGDKVVFGMDSTTTSAIGAAFGAAVAGPIGAVVGGVLGGIFDAAFGSGPKVTGTTTLAGDFSSSGFAGQYQTPWSQEGGWFSSGSSGIDYQALAQEQIDAFALVTAGTKSVFDDLIAVSGDAAQSIDGWTFAINQQVSTQEQQNQLVIDMANSMGSYLIPSLESFMLEGENLADTAVRLRDEFILTDFAASLLGVDVATAFGAIGLASLEARDDLINLLGGMTQMSATMQAYYEFTTTSAERQANDLATVTAAMDALGFVMPTTAAGFDAMVSAQMELGPAGAEGLAALLNLTPAIAAIIPSADDAAQAALEMADTFVQMAANMANSLAQLGNTQFGIDLATTAADATMAAVTAAMPWITSIGQLSTITAADYSDYGVNDLANNTSNQSLIDAALSAAADLLSATSTVATDTYTAAADTYTYTSDVIDTAASAADIFNQKLDLMAQSYDLLATAATDAGDATAAANYELMAAKVLEEQRAIALAELDPTLQTLQTNLWALEDAATAAAEAATLAATNLNLQQQIDVLQGTQTQSAVDLANALNGVDATTAALITTLFGLEDAATAAAEAATLAATNLNLQQQIDVLMGTQTQSAVDLANALNGVDATTAALITTLFGLEDAATAAAEAATLAATNLGWQQRIDVLMGTQTQSAVDLANALNGVDATTAALITTLFGLQDAATAAADAQALAEENLSGAKSALLDAYNSESSAAQQLADQMTGFASGFTKLRNSLNLGALSTLSPEAKYLEAKLQFEDVSRRAQLGDLAALGDLENVSQSFLEASRDYNASSELYAMDFSAVSAALDSSAATATRQAGLATEQVDLLESQLAALGLINSSVLSVADALVAFQFASDAASAAAAAIAPIAVSTPIPTATIPTDVIAGSTTTTLATGTAAQVAALYESMLGREADFGGLNYWVGQANASGGVAGIVDAFRNGAIAAGEVPAYATGGYHSGGLRLVGEHGPEMEATGPARIYNFEQTRQMLKGNDNAETNKLLKEVVTELRALVNQGGAVGSATLNKLEVVADKLDGNKRELARAA